MVRKTGGNFQDWGKLTSGLPPSLPSEPEKKKPTNLHQDKFTQGSSLESQGIAPSEEELVIDDLGMADLLKDLEQWRPAKTSRKSVNTNRRISRNPTSISKTESRNVPLYSGDKVPSSGWSRAVDAGLAKAGVPLDDVVLHWTRGDRIDDIETQGFSRGGATTYGAFVFSPRHASKTFGINCCDAIVVLRKSDFKVTQERTAGGSGIAEFVPKHTSTPLFIIDPKTAQAHVPKRKLL